MACDTKNFFVFCDEVINSLRSENILNALFIMERVFLINYFILKTKYQIYWIKGKISPN